MKTVKIYTTDTCPKCKTLKTFIESLGVDFEVLDMSLPKNMAHLMAYGGWPNDNGAPTLETVDPTLHEDPICWTHDVLFDRGHLQKWRVAKILGKEYEEP